MKHRKCLKINTNKTTKSYRYSKATKVGSFDNIENLENSIKEMEELIKSLEDIKNEYYSTNAKLEEIQKIKASVIIRSIFDRISITNKQKRKQKF